MKFIAVFSVLFACALAASIPREFNAVEPYGIFEDYINSTFNDVIHSLPDPLLIEKLDIPTIEVDDLKVTLNLSNVELRNLQHIVLSKIHVTILPFLPISAKITTTVPSIELDTEYALEFVNGTETIKAHGKFSGSIENLNIDIDAKLKGSIIPPAFKIQDLSLGVPDLAKNTKVKATITDEDDPDLAQEINNNIDYWIPNILQLIDDNQKAISDVISPIIIDVINGVLPKLEQQVEH